MINERNVQHTLRTLLIIVYCTSKYTLLIFTNFIYFQVDKINVSMIGHLK